MITDGEDTDSKVTEEEAIEAIVQKAVERKTGARGLRAIVEQIMIDIMYEIPSIKDHHCPFRPCQLGSRDHHLVNNGEKNKPKTKTCMAESKEVENAAS